MREESSSYMYIIFLIFIVLTVLYFSCKRSSRSYDLEERNIPMAMAISVQYDDDDDLDVIVAVEAG